MMADFIGSDHRHEEGDLCPLLVCSGILQRVEAVSLENKFSQACQVMEFLLDLHDRYYIIQKSNIFFLLNTKMILKFDCFFINVTVVFF